jgi:hypothetical protein
MVEDGYLEIEEYQKNVEIGICPTCRVGGIYPHFEM